MSSFERRRPKRRVLIADDSALMRSLLIEQIGANTDFEVAGEAATGYEAIRLVHELKPDVLTLDLAMPDLGGLEALHYIMSQAPLPVVIVSAQSRALADSALRALMDYGAVDIVPKPLGGSVADMQEFRQRLTQSLYLSLTARLRHLPAQMRTPHRSPHAERTEHTRARCAVAIAASTGGPLALSEIVPRLPADLPAAILIVQHMPALFTTYLARRLDALSELTVRDADQGLTIEEGVVYVAHGGMHLDLERRDGAVHVQLTDGPALWGVRPAADVLFHGVARTFGPASVGVVLTGMGRDGADGARAIAAVGGSTLVQDEESCVVPSMPRSAAAFSDAVVPLEDIAASIVARAKSRVGSRHG
jgi:two-component system, chemotaxis family, protein-glutamate methylesterase/glutaminase